DHEPQERRRAREGRGGQGGGGHQEGRPDPEGQVGLPGKPMKGTVRAISFLTTATIAVAAVAATTLRSTWKAPGAQPGTFRGKKVVTLFVSPDEQERRAVEGLLADELTKRGAQGVPAVSLVPTEEIREEAKVRPRLAAAGVAGAVVFRTVSEDRKL